LLGRARLIEKSPPCSGLSRSGTALFLKPFPSLSLFSRLSDSLLPLLFLHWRRRLGERRRHLSCLRPALCRRRAILQVCPPFLFPSAVRDGAPQTLTKLFVFGSESSYNVLPTNFDFVCKNYRVYMFNQCHMLGPPLMRVCI